MSVTIIENYKLNAPVPLDTKYVTANEASRLSMEFPYNGLITYQMDTKVFYKYTNSTWGVIDSTSYKYWWG